MDAFATRNLSLSIYQRLLSILVCFLIRLCFRAMNNLLLGELLLTVSIPVIKGIFNKIIKPIVTMSSS